MDDVNIEVVEVVEQVDVVVEGQQQVDINATETPNVDINVTESDAQVNVDVVAGDQIDVEVSESANVLWGGIFGTLSNQADLQAALDAKQDLLGYTPADSAITITGAGLLGGQGGDLTANRVFTLNNSDIDHGGLSGLADDDHPQYFLADGSREITGDYSSVGISTALAFQTRSAIIATATIRSSNPAPSPWIAFNLEEDVVPSPLPIAFIGKARVTTGPNAGAILDVTGASTSSWEPGYDSFSINPGTPLNIIGETVEFYYDAPARLDDTGLSFLGSSELGYYIDGTNLIIDATGGSGNVYIRNQLFLSGELDLGGFKAVNAANPTLPQDLVTYGFAETVYGNHAYLSNLNWSSAGHIIDASIDMNGQQILNAGNVEINGNADFGTNIITDEEMFGDWDMHSGALTNVNIDSGTLDGITGTSNLTDLILSGLTDDLGVYTNGSKQLTSTPPSSGVLGYFERSVTTIAPSNENDSLNFETGYTDTSVPAIAGTLTLTQGGSGNWVGSTTAIARIYGYVVVRGVKYFSSNYITSNTLAASGFLYSIDAAWTDTNPAYDGYRIEWDLTNTFAGVDIDWGEAYNDDVATPYILTAANTVTSPFFNTPTSYRTYNTDYPIITNGIQASNGLIVSGGIEFEDEITLVGGLKSPGASLANGAIIALNYSTVDGIGSCSFGGDITGDFNLSTGQGNSTTGNWNLVAGKDNTNTGDYSLVSGFGVDNAGAQSIVSGIGHSLNSNADASIACGAYGTLTNRETAHFGGFGIVSGRYGAHFGKYGVVTAESSTHFGDGGIVAGRQCIHFGYQGELTSVAQFGAHFGNVGEVSANIATHFGTGNLADTANCVTFGRYSASTGGSATAWVATDPLVIFGNGSSSSNRNTMSIIYKNGNYWVEDNIKQIQGLSNNFEQYFNGTNEIFNLTLGFGDFIFTNGSIQLPSDSEYYYAGAGNDMRIGYNGTDALITTDLVAASDLLIDCGTDKTIELVETVWDDLRVPAQNTKINPAKSEPAFEEFVDGLYTYKFSTTNEDTDSVHFIAQIPHTWKEGTDLEPHVHWAPDNTNTGNVRWEFEYVIQDIDSAFPASATSDTITAAASGTIRDHLVDVFTDIDCSGLSISSILICRLTRMSDSDVLDTYTGNACFLEFDFHYQKDTIGSRTEYTK